MSRLTSLNSVFRILSILCRPSITAGEKCTLGTARFSFFFYSFILFFMSFIYIFLLSFEKRIERSFEIGALCCWLMFCERRARINVDRWKNWKYYISHFHTCCFCILYVIDPFWWKIFKVLLYKFVIFIFHMHKTTHIKMMKSLYLFINIQWKL